MPLALEEIVDVFGMSEFQLRKVFFFLFGMTLNEYIKRRYLTCATQDILDGVPITQVAYVYCYESFDGFSCAYKTWIGYLPREIRKEHIITTTPKLSFKTHVEGETTIPAFNFVGVSKRVLLQFEGVNHEIVNLAQSISELQR